MVFRHTLSSKTYLGYGIQGTADIEDTLRIAWDALGHHDASTALLADFINMRAALANDDRCILRHNKASHVDVC